MKTDAKPTHRDLFEVQHSPHALRQLALMKPPHSVEAQYLSLRQYLHLMCLSSHSLVVVLLPVLLPVLGAAVVVVVVVVVVGG